MTYKCQHCGWTPKDTGFHTTSDDIQKIFDHEKNKCIKKRGVYNGTYK